MTLERKATSAVVVILLCCTGLARAQPAHDQEHHLKAAVIYNLVRFTDWPESKLADTNQITIGLLGDISFADAFDPVRDKPVAGLTLVVKDLGPFSRRGKEGKTDERLIEQMRSCHLLFICNSEKSCLKDILAAVADHNVLTVGESAGFLEAGGMINFVPGAGKPVFEVNQTACEKEHLKISSRVLRLAVRVLRNEDESAH